LDASAYLKGALIEPGDQGVGNEIIDRMEAQREGLVDTRERLGGLLKYYHRRAA
jgi:hypothetical protein